MRFDRNIRIKSACNFLHASAFFSGSASGILLLAFPWFLLEKTGSALDVGFIQIIPCVLIIVALPLFGFLLNRFATKKVYFCFLVINIVIMTVLYFLFEIFNINITLIFITFCYVALIKGIEQVGRVTLAQKMINKDQYGDLNRKLEFIRQTVTLFSGILFALVGKLALCNILLLCIGLSLISIIFLLLVMHQMPAESKEKAVQIESKASIKTVNPLNQWSQVVYFFLLSLPFAIIVVQNALYPSHIQQFLMLPKIYYALMVIPYSIGAFGAVYLMKFFVDTSHEVFFRMAFLGYFLAIILVILIPHWIVFYFALLLFSLSHGFIRIKRLTLMMQTYDIFVFGRAISFYDTVTTFNIICLTITSCFLIDKFSVTAAWVLLLMVFTAGFLVLHILSRQNTYAEKISSIT